MEVKKRKEIVIYGSNAIEEIECKLKDNVKTDKKLKDLRIEGIINLLNCSRFYDNEYMEGLVNKIYFKKIDQLKEASTKEDVKLILGYADVHYNGGKLVSKHKYCLIEEELLVWSNTSLQAPLSHEGFERYMECFKEVFPEHVKDILKTN